VISELPGAGFSGAGFVLTLNKEFKIMMTNEEGKVYDMHGKQLQKEFKKTIGRLLLEERLKRNMRLEEITILTQIKQHRIEDMEFGKHKFHWCIVARLLQVYKKAIGD